MPFATLVRGALIRAPHSERLHGMRVPPEYCWLCIDARRDGLHLSKVDGKQGEYCSVL